MNEQLLAPASNRLEAIENQVRVHGMLTVTSDKTQRASLQLMKKKAYMDAWKKRNPGQTNKAAVAAFDAYRTATLRDFNSQIAMQIASGNIVADRINADGDGNLKTINLVKRSAAEQDKENEAIARIARLLGKSPEDLRKEINAHKPQTQDAQIVEEAAQNAAPASPAAPEGQAPAPEAAAPASAQPVEPQNVAAGQ